MSNSVEAPGSSPNESDVPAAPASDSAPPPQKAPPSPSSKNVSPLPPTTKESSPPSPQSTSPPAKSLPPSQLNAPPPKQSSPPPPKSKSPPPNQSSPPPPQSDASPPEESSTPPPHSDSPPPSTPTSSPPPSKSNSSPPPSPPKPSNNPPINSQTTPESPPAPMLSPPPESSSATLAEKSSPPPPENSSPVSDTTSPPPSAGGSVSPASGGLQQSQPPLTESMPPSSPLDPNKPNAPPNQATSSSGQVGRPPSRGSPSGDSSSTSPNSKGRTDSGIELGDANDDSGHAAGKVVAVAAVVSVLLIMVIGVFFLARRRKNRRHISTNNFSPKTDGVLYGQVPHSNVGTPNQFLGSQPSPIADSYGSPRTGNTHPGGTPDSAFIGSSKIFFSYEELMELTSAFSHQNIIGEGGFGCVYKGCMQDGKMVAVKQLKLGSGQGDREFKAEVEIISRVHHRHLVSLVGYCISDNQRLLIYDFVPNKTLEHHLHRNGLPVLDWTKRLKIAIGSAKGLAYLHEDCYPKIIHRDIKSANILLDDDFEAQVADFGLARLNDTARSHVSTRVMGTFGYLAPEYATSGKLTDKSDVFSFGVVLLELISGRKPIDPTQPLGDESLVEWARPLLIEAIESGDLGELVDPRLGKNYVENEMFRMVETAAACVRHSASKRPRMVQVVRVLDSENELSDISNGVKFGKSIEYDFDQYSEDIRNFRRMALGSSAGTTSSEFDISSGEYASGVASLDLPELPVTGSISGESETRAMNRSNPETYGSDRLV